MTRAEFCRRLRALGYETAGEAARGLGLPESSVHRMWEGERPIQPRTVRMLELLEAAQPAPMSYPVRLLLTQPPITQVGDVVPQPQPRSRFEANWDWAPVFREAEKAGLVARWGSAYTLTPLGARAMVFLRQTQGNVSLAARAGVKP